jgi:deoxyribodipyrimidine photo-lyase
LTHLVWFRNDLRVADNPALHDACASSRIVLACFLISDTQWDTHDMGAVRRSFLGETLQALRKDLARLNIPLRVVRAPRFQDAPAALLDIAHDADVTDIHFNAEYPLDEQRRDERVAAACADRGIGCHVHHGDVMLPPGHVLKDDGSPYSVFTPFKRRWLTRLNPGDLDPLPVPEPRPAAPAAEVPDPQDAIERLRTEPAAEDWPAGEQAAVRRLDAFIESKVEAYDARRDHPGAHATSGLSPYLAVGAISVRTCYRKTSGKDLDEDGGASAWRNELIWREFYRHVTFLFPHISRGCAFNRDMDDLPWRSDPAALDAWKSGRTGYPLVDAGMRQLLETGFMHNRLRMVTAMFLTKHLLIDWREGERHFMQHLRDGDFPSNNGGWQWSASTGTDAAPYFRIFNPESQAKKFDPKSEFIRAFVPELSDGNADYPPPIVDHREARERALDFFKRR